MFLETKYKIETNNVYIVVRRQTKERLAKTCFRGTDKPLAGNFSIWNDIYDLFANPTVIQDFIHDADEAVREQSWGTNSVSIKLDSPVGWAGTDDVARYRLEDLESFQPNRRSCALRVRQDRLDLKAPQTDLLTIVYELRHEQDFKESRIILIVHSVYPGHDIGELGGDITFREKCVFFDWSHPGSV